ncbi:MAG: glycosyltransferase family 2 protein [Deltaproteobacteria bacterium]|nr:glycosyltransferase family 2 protein [Deltaproteobacteria bacterium]
MRDAKPPIVDVIITARDDELSIGSVIAGIPPRIIRSIVVVDNGSTDKTSQLAEDAGAIVLRESRVGQGSACLRGLTHLATLPKPPDVVVFCPADGSFDGAELPSLLMPLRGNLFDLAIGSRVLGSERHSPRIKLENLLTVGLIRAVYGHKYTDLSPFRAIRYPALVALGMRDTGHGWHVEMQVKALRTGLRVAEVPVRYHPQSARKRPLGEQVKGATLSTTKALFRILRHSTAR